MDVITGDGLVFCRMCLGGGSVTDTVFAQWEQDKAEDARKTLALHRKRVRQEEQRAAEWERDRPQRELERKAEERREAAKRERQEWFRNHKTALTRILGVVIVVSALCISWLIGDKSWLLTGFLYLVATGGGGLIFWTKSDNYSVDITKDGHVIYQEPDHDFQHEMTLLVDQKNKRFVVRGASKLTKERQKRVLEKFDGMADLQ